MIDLKNEFSKRAVDRNSQNILLRLVSLNQTANFLNYTLGVQSNILPINDKFKLRLIIKQSENWVNCFSTNPNQISSTDISTSFTYMDSIVNKYKQKE